MYLRQSCARNKVEEEEVVRRIVNMCLTVAIEG